MYIDKTISYSGALIKITITTINEGICEEILRHSDVLKAFEVIQRHGECRLFLENPIRIVSGDGAI